MGTVEKLLELRLQLGDLEVVHGDFAEQFGLFKLCLEQVLLVSHPGAVACVRCFLDLLEQLSVAFKNPECLREIGELEIGCFDSGEDRAAHGFVLLLRNVRISFCDLAL